jgi:endonuclease YncB( thermonuclease family)
VCAFSGILFAEGVADVGADGTLVLADGKRVVLAGIQMDEEGVSVLRVLVRKQTVKLQLVGGAASGGKNAAYVYLQSKYVKFPGKSGEEPGEEEVLLNEFLVKIGAAKVVDSQEFSHKAGFLKSQAEARKKGEGVWSYGHA